LRLRGGIDQKGEVIAFFDPKNPNIVIPPSSASPVLEDGQCGEEWYVPVIRRKRRASFLLTVRRIFIYVAAITFMNHEHDTGTKKTGEVLTFPAPK
jgi:hypothetical protein